MGLNSKDSIALLIEKPEISIPSVRQTKPANFSSGNFSSHEDASSRSGVSSSIVMAKSGQWSSQNRHPTHCSGCSTTGEPASSRPSTFLGQNALQIPQDLHQSWKITCRYLFLRESFCGGVVSGDSGFFPRAVRVFFLPGCLFDSVTECSFPFSSFPRKPLK